MNDIGEIKYGSIIEVDLRLVTDPAIIKPGQYLTHIKHYWAYNHITERIVFYVSCGLSAHNLDECLKPQANVNVNVVNRVIDRIYNGLCAEFVPVAVIHKGMLDNVAHWPTTGDYKQYLRGVFGNDERLQIKVINSD